MPWDTEEMVPLEDFDGTVVGSVWKPGVEGTVQLELTWQVHEVYAPAEAANPGETKTWYSTGKAGKWDIIDGGMRVVPAQQGQRFHASSKYGMLLDRVAKELDIQAVISKGEPEESTIWIGERFRMQRVAQSYKDLAGAEGEEKRNVDTSIMLPTEYRTAGATTAPQPAAGAPVPTSPVPASFAIADTDLAIIQALAKGKSSDGKGQAVRIAIAREPRLNENVPLMEALLNNPDAIVELEAAGKLVVQNGVYQ
jgi:hypothetical protein